MPGDRLLIGRDAELAALAAAIEADRATTVIGEAGIGKTALVRRAVERSDRALREGGAFATLRETPYLALSRAVGANLAGDPASVAARVETLVGPDVLFIDDLQWADLQTLAVIELLAGRILVLSAIRSLDPGAEAASARLRGVGAAFQELTPLASTDARTLVLARRPDLQEGVVDDIVRRAAGNPLLLEEMAERGQASPVLARVLTSRLDLLSPAARGVVELLAIADRPLTADDLDEAADEAIAAGIAVETERGVELRHQLVADAVREALDAPSRQGVHARVAQLLGDGPEAARHLAEAGRASEAADLALRALAAAGDVHERAALLVIAAEAGPPESGLPLRIAAARALDEVADWAGVTRVLGAVELASPGLAANPEGVAEAHALLAHAAYSLGDVEAARSHVAAMDGVDVRPASSAAIRRAIEAATFLVNVDGAVPAAIARLGDALSALPPGHAGAEDIAVLRDCILLLATGAGSAYRIRDAADAAFEARRYRTATDRNRVIQYLLNMTVSGEEAVAFLLDRHARYEASGMGSMASDFLADAVVAAILVGRLGDAVTTADRLLEQPASVRARQTAEIHRARALVLIGRIDEAEAVLERLRPAVSLDYFGLAETLLGLAEAALWGGRPEAAEGLADAGLAIPVPIPVARIPLLLTRAWARRERGLDLDVPTLEGPLNPSVAAAPVELAAIAASAAGDPAAAADGFTTAAAMWARFNEPRRLICRWAAGEASREAGHEEHARADLRAVLEEAVATGFEPLAARIRRALRLLGVHVSGTGAGTATRGPGLTVRERELVALVERGLTNVEIARRLGLGRPTVARILTSAMTKLGVSSRAQLAAEAPR